MAILGSEYMGKAQRFWSPNIWAKTPWGRGVNNQGILQYDDFTGLRKTTGISTALGRFASGSGGFRSFEGTDLGVTALLTEPTGVMRLSTVTTTANLETTIQSGACCKLTRGDATVAWEAKAKFQSILTQSVFLGLAPPDYTGLDATPPATALFFSGTATQVNISFIGFRILGSVSNSTLAFVYKLLGQTEVVVKAAVKAPIVANTAYNFGFVFDARDNSLEAFLDNVSVAAPVIIGSAANPASTFPESIVFAQTGVIKNNGTAAAGGVQVDVDDWACGYDA